MRQKICNLFTMFNNEIILIKITYSIKLFSFVRFKYNPQYLDFTQMVGGAGRVRTDDLRLAKAALSQLSYSPIF